MTEDDTFEALRRISFEKALDNVLTGSHILDLQMARREMIEDIYRHKDKLISSKPTERFYNCCPGWEFEDFIKEAVRIYEEKFPNLE